MKIEFSGEAGETFARFVGEIKDLVVEVETIKGERFHGEPFDAVVVDTANQEEGWYDAVRLLPFDEDTGGPCEDGIEFTVRVERLHVY